MEYRYLGNTGLKVSALCLGTMQFGWSADENQSHEILNIAFDHGINFIDTADIYSRWVDGNPGGVSEAIIGNWLREHKIPRDKIIIATKVRGEMGPGPNDQGLSRAHIFNAVDASLRRLRVDYIDLFQAHWYDDKTPIEETLAAFNDLIRIGKVRYIGASNYPAWRLMQALWAADKMRVSGYATFQPHYNLMHRSEFEDGLEEVCQTYGLGVIPYSPLAGGFLTGKYHPAKPLPTSVRADSTKRRYFTDAGWKTLEVMEAIGRKRGKSISQIALGWLLSNPVITSPIIGPRTAVQLQDNLGSCRLRLTADELDDLNTCSTLQENQ